VRRAEQDDLAELLREAVGHVEREIENLRAIITELRPAALDELGLVPAIEALVGRLSAIEGLEIACAVELPGTARRLSPELETTVYRIVQEALTNVVKHARADHARVSVRAADGQLEIEVSDDGAGFDPAVATSGFGVAGMRERVGLSGGRLSVTPSDTGTRVRAELPLSELDEAVVEGVSHEIGA
jgi:signal transduction histidine kinase